MPAANPILEVFPAFSERFRSGACNSCVSFVSPLEVSPPGHDPKPTRDREDDDQGNNPWMRNEPQNYCDVVAMPRSAWTVAEESVRLGVEVVGEGIKSVEACRVVNIQSRCVMVWNESLTRSHLASTSVILPFIPSTQIPALQNVAGELRPRREVNRQIRKQQVPIPSLELRRHLPNDWMLLSRRKDVVVDSQQRRLWKPCRKLQKRVEGASAVDIKVHVDTAVVKENEVLERIDALDWISVAVIRWDEPGIMFFDQIARGSRIPYFDCEILVSMLTMFRGLRASCRDLRDVEVRVVEIAKPNEVDDGRNFGIGVVVVKGDVVIEVDCAMFFLRSDEGEGVVGGEVVKSDGEVFKVVLEVVLAEDDADTVEKKD